jgi:hypothetical protein
MNAMASRRMRGVAAATLLMMCGTALDAAAQDHWGTVGVPGGAAAARQVADLGRADRPAVNLLVDLTYAVHAQRLADQSDPAATLRDYFDYLSRLRAALDPQPPDLRLPDFTDATAAVSDPGRGAIGLLGLRLDRSGPSPGVVPDDGPDVSRRTEWLSALGLDRHEIARRLSRGEAVAIEWRDDVIPLPLPDLWRTVVFDGRPASIAGVASSPENLLLYLGLVSLDAQTLAWLGTRPDVFEAVAGRDLVGPFAAFGRSLRVRDQSIVTPGSPSDVRLWEVLVGARADDPASFVTRVLGRGNGRLAYFYDTAVRLDEPARSALLGGHLAGPGQSSDRLRFMKRTSDAFAKFAPMWRVRERPFFRPMVDPALVLATVNFRADGTAGPSWWTALLERAFGRCSWNRAAAPLGARPAAADANWLLRWVFEKSGTPADRLAALRLLQRRFAGAPAAAAGDLEIALCARLHLPALVLALDRMGVERPAVYADLALTARRLTGRGAGLSTLRAWQGALGLLEQAVRHRGLPPAVVEDLLSSLARAAPERAGEPPGAIAAWVFDDLLPGLGARSGTSGALEPIAVGALVGVDRGDDLEFEWEGLRYRLDTAGRAARSVAAILEASAGPRLDQLRLLLNAGILSLADEVAAEVLPALAYALAMSPAAGPPEIYAEAHRFHVFAGDAPDGGVEAQAWAIPQVVPRPEGGSRVRGAMLGLDLARAPDQLRRVATGGPVERPVITEADYMAGSERLVLRAHGAPWDTAGGEIAAAIERGRQVVAGWMAAPPSEAGAEDVLMRAAVSPWRASLVRWLLATGEGAILDGYFTMTELYRLGTPADLPHAWGQSGWLVESCWCLRSAGRRAPEDWLGRSASLAASTTSDLPLRITELLAALGLPHALLETLLPMAQQDAVDQAQQISTADWEALAWPRHLAASRVERYMLELLADGLLAAPRGARR